MRLRWPRCRDGVAGQCLMHQCAHRAKSFVLSQLLEIGAPPPRQIPCACHTIRIILGPRVFACMKSKELASVFVWTVCRKSTFARQCIGFEIGIVEFCCRKRGPAAYSAKALEPSPSWHRQLAFHHRRSGAGTGSRETSAVVAHQLPQTTAAQEQHCSLRRPTSTDGQHGTSPE